MTKVTKLSLLAFFFSVFTVSIGIAPANADCKPSPFNSSNSWNNSRSYNCPNGVKATLKPNIGSKWDDPWGRYTANYSNGAKATCKYDSFYKRYNCR